jgi:hypothetical protein
MSNLSKWKIWRILKICLIFPGDQPIHEEKTQKFFNIGLIVMGDLPVCENKWKWF